MKKNCLYLVVLAASALVTGAVFSETLKEAQQCITGPVTVGADRVELIVQHIQDKRAGLIVNQTSVLHNGVHLLDTLLNENIRVIKVFAPEHGLRGTEEAGEVVVNGMDSKSGIPVISLYGNNNKPADSQLADIDVLIFDIQDIGARFYTYISTMHYAMEACAANGKEFMVLDRPNPNDYVDGPVRKAGFSSFIGVDPIPVLHGLTVGELACMINGEGWITTGKNSCHLIVVPMKNWSHGDPYSLPVKPSPNLPNDQAIRLYPSLCFFEGTTVSVGRGTFFPFQALGGLGNKYGEFTFTPQPIRGMDSNPLHNGIACYGIDLREMVFEGGLTLRFVLDFYEKSGYNEKSFFTRPRHFDLLAGSEELRLQIVKRWSEEEIRNTWQSELDEYKMLREKYLIYN